jgi:hypothetical protein
MDQALNSREYSLSSVLIWPVFRLSFVGRTVDEGAGGTERGGAVSLLEVQGDYGGFAVGPSGTSVDDHAELQRIAGLLAIEQLTKGGGALVSASIERESLTLCLRSGPTVILSVPDESIADPWSVVLDDGDGVEV